MSWLVLSREVDQDIVIVAGKDRITIRVVGATKGKARLGIDAPAHITVDRKEVADRIAKEGYDRRVRRKRHPRVARPGGGGS